MNLQMITTWQLGAIELLTDNIEEFFRSYTPDDGPLMAFLSSLDGLRVRLDDLNYANTTWGPGFGKAAEILQTLLDGVDAYGIGVNHGFMAAEMVLHLREGLRLYKEDVSSRKLQDLLEGSGEPGAGVGDPIEDPIAPWRPAATPFVPSPVGIGPAMLYGSGDADYWQPPGSNGGVSFGDDGND